MPLVGDAFVALQRSHFRAAFTNNGTRPVELMVDPCQGAVPVLGHMTSPGARRRLGPDTAMAKATHAGGGRLKKMMLDADQYLSQCDAFSHEFAWFGPRAEPEALVAFGFRLKGGGAHQSKTMMLQELDALLAIGHFTGNEIKAAAVDQNILGKSTRKTREITFRNLSSLFGLVEQPPMTKILFKLWQADTDGHRLQALLVALARDPLLRDTAQIIVTGTAGKRLQRPLFEELLERIHPHRFSRKMLRSLAQNCASTWTQSGHLEGAIKKIRRLVSPTSATVALAAMLATVAGYGGPAILSSNWIKVLDLSPDQALDHLRRAESLGLARVRSAGDVTEIAVRQPMASTLQVPEIEQLR